MTENTPEQHDETTDAQPTAPVPDPSSQQPTAEIPPAYQQPAYQQAGYQQAGYQQPGYQQAGYPQAQYQQPGYQQPGSPYGYPPPAAPRTDDKAIWALVSSIAGFILLPIVLHVVGWVLANQSLRSIRESNGALGGDGVAKTARVLGIVGVVLYSIGLVLLLAFLAIAIPLGLFAASTSVDSVDFGDETVRPAVVSEIDGRSFSHDAGEITYDLTDVEFSGETVDMQVQLGAGTLSIEVPDDVTVSVDAQVGAGEIDVFGQRTEGVGLSRSSDDAGTDDGGSLELDLEVAVGVIEVSRG